MWPTVPHPDHVADMRRDRWVEEQLARHEELAETAAEQAADWLSDPDRWD